MDHKRASREGSIEVGGGEMACEAAKIVAAHKQVQAAAEQVSAKLDEISIGRPLISGGEPGDSIVLAIERAQRRVGSTAS